jgi:hypothetical protein
LERRQGSPRPPTRPAAPIVDAGLKALAFGSGPPLVCDEPAAYHRASDEHGRLAVGHGPNHVGSS